MSDMSLRVKWPDCKARGLCHELAPEIISLDPWGYPILPQELTTEEELALARDAVAACPRQALAWVRKVT